MNRLPNNSMIHEPTRNTTKTEKIDKKLQVLLTIKSRQYIIRKTKKRYSTDTIQMISIAINPD